MSARRADKAEIERFHSALANLAEIVAFTVLGLTVSRSGLNHGTAWLIRLRIAALLALIIRPVLVGAPLLPLRLTGGERVFIAWSGLKGAAPILLGTYLFVRRRAVGLVPAVARRAGVPMRTIEPEPWSLQLRMRAA